MILPFLDLGKATGFCFLCRKNVAFAKDSEREESLINEMAGVEKALTSKLSTVGKSSSSGILKLSVNPSMELNTEAVRSGIRFTRADHLDFLSDSQRVTLVCSLNLKGH